MNIVNIDDKKVHQYHSNMPLFYKKKVFKKQGESRRHTDITPIY